MTYFFPKALLQQLRFEVLSNLGSKLAQVIDELGEGLNDVALEVSKVDKNSEFF